MIKNIKYNKEITYLEDVCKVYKVTSYDDYDKVFVKIGNYRFLFNTNEYNLTSGDIVYIKGSIKHVSHAHFKNGFNYHEYLKYQNIYSTINIEYLQVVDHKISLNIFHEKLSSYIRNKYRKENSDIIEALLIGEKSNLNNDVSENIKVVGISHLFVISGLHIEVINKALDKVLSIFKVKNKYKNSIILIILFMYYILTSMLVSILRVIISFIFNKLLKKFVLNLSVIDKLSLNACIVLLINPFNLFSYSFLLSYMIVFGILIISPKLKEEKNILSFLYNNVIISCISTIISLPIVVRISPDVNLLSIIFNLFFIPFVSYILLPSSFLVLVIPKLEFLYSYIVNAFLFLISKLSNIKVFIITFSHFNLILVIVFYLLFLLSFVNKKYRFKKIFILSFCIYLIFLYYIPYFNITDEISFLDLPSGDATFIHTKFNKRNILIDTGDLDANDLISFLKNKGVKKLDAVIISHGDSDHIGGLRSLIYEFKIRNIYLSYYDNASFNEIKKYYLPNTNIYYLKKGDEFYIDNLYFKVLWPSNNQNDVNNNSLVIYSVIFNMRILFTGDIESLAEGKLIKEIGQLDVDILKVAHHGSKTSTTAEFLKYVKFKYAVSMNGYQNTFGFPHQTIVNRIKNIEGVILYNTKDYGTITFYRNLLDKQVKIMTSFK